MKNRLSFRILIALLSISLIMVSCNEDEPMGEIFSWSPDGKKLAIITDQSKELLIADIETDSIGNVSVIDNYRGKENDIFAPRWSYDGKYFLYTKIENENSTLLIYSVSNNDLTLLNTIPIGLPLLRFAASKPVHFPEWAPDKNLILFTETNDENDEQLVTINPDGSDKKVLTQFDGDFIFPTWSFDGQWIAYSVENGKNAGIWKIKSDGSNSKKIFSTKNILQLKWAPDGSKLAFLQKSIEKKDSTQVLKLIDSDGQAAQIISQVKNKIHDFDWSPDGRYISYVRENDKKKNTWLVETKTLQKTRLTFDNVKDYFGWQKPDQLLFTIKQPETILDLSESQKNKQELSELMRGVNKENVLISFNSSNFSKTIKNVLTYKYCPANKTHAFMQICRTPELLGNELYLPAVQFPNGNIDYLPRIDEEYIIAADNQFLNQDYDKALKYINNYWNVDLRSPAFKAYFNADSIIRAEEINQDSAHVDLMIESLRNSALIKTIMILDRLEQIEKVSWLFDQYHKYISFYLENEKNNQDELYWNLIAAYGKYGEFNRGINDLEELLVSVEGDSQFKCFTNIACAFLAFENESYNKCLEKIKVSFQNMPAGKVELEPYNTLISVFLEETNYEYNADLILLLKQFLHKYPDNRDSFDTMVLLGDYYLKLGENDKALINYQKAISKKSDKQQVWDKIFELEMR
ncbi:PD40 domain-containing protein [candidate division KSB1 bacterium]|nr:PD40 domain-containing protein [candidate division KSB1 bacterium]MBL7093494.1 PD40 domain-containing protein [candidate division KSB1 bacterium]